MQEADKTNQQQTASVVLCETRSESLHFWKRVFLWDDMMNDEQVKQSILATADQFGEIRFFDSPPPQATKLVKEGRLVRLSYFVFSLPEGG